MGKKEHLELISKDLWCSGGKEGRGPFKFDIRMTVLRLQSGGLLLHSPIAIDETIKDELNQLGIVEHIVAPNCFHHLYASRAKQLFPDAMLWASPGLRDKRNDINFDAVINEQQPDWGNTVEFRFIAGMPVLNEVVFFHKPSRSLICSDLVFNIQKGSNVFIRSLWRLFGVWKTLGQSRSWRFMVKNREEVTSSINSVLQWKFERVIMAHGDIVECDRYGLYEVLKKKNKDIVI